MRHEFDEKVIIKRKEYREDEISKIEEIMSLDLRGRATINCINGKIIIKSDEDKNFATMASDIDSEYNYFELTERMKKSTTYTLSIRDAICLADGSKITFFKEIEQNWDWDEDEWI